MNGAAPKIQDYAIIGDARSAALVSNRGSIDWLCWPRFDSASIFAAILDPKIGGHWSIRPVQPSQSARRYIDQTNVLETTLSSESGKVVLTDFMPVTSEERKEQMLWPEHELIRQIECVEGEVALILDFCPRIDYGRSSPPIKDAGKLGWRIELVAAVGWAS
jgi:GH15 family glucan-1,4-alpha-glucosidase